MDQFGSAVVIGRVGTGGFERNLVRLPNGCVAELREAERAIDPIRFMRVLIKYKALMNYTTVNVLFQAYIRLCILQKLGDAGRTVAEIPVVFFPDVPVFNAFIMCTSTGFAVGFTRMFNMAMLALFRFLIASSEPTCGTSSRTQVAPDEAIRGVLQLAKYVVSFGQLPPPTFPKVDGLLLREVDDRNNLLHCFALAHEFGHFAKGHLESDIRPIRLSVAGTDGLDIIPATLSQEIDADRFSLRVCRYRSPMANSALLTSVYCFLMFAKLCRILEGEQGSAQAIDARWDTIAREHAVGRAVVLEPSYATMDAVFRRIESRGESSASQNCG